ncbi:hypothetical protein Tco_0732192 [Tanacetum coccineum]
MDHECFDIRDNEFEEKLKAQRIKDQEFLDTFKELCDSVIKKQREERERIAKEKEAEELEAERKKKECLKIENSLPKASTRSRRSRIDPSLKGFKVFCKTISSGKMQRIPEESEEIDISCDMIPPGIDTDDDSKGDVPPFEEPLDDGLFPLPKVDILPIEVEPVEDQGLKSVVAINPQTLAAEWGFELRIHSTPQVVVATILFGRKALRVADFDELKFDNLQ